MGAFVKNSTSYITISIVRPPKKKGLLEGTKIMEVYVVVTCLGVGRVEGMIWVGGERYTLRKISIENNRERFDTCQ
jgi:hypothetical protein